MFKKRAGRIWLFQIFVALASCVLTVFAIEIGLTLVRPVPFSIEANMYFEADPYTGFRLKPGGVGHFQMGIPAMANSQGHRDVEVPLKKQPGKFRILVIGDSFTVGANVRQDEAYSKVLEVKLRRKFGNQIEVVNSGVGGWEPFQYAQYFEHYGRRLEPDLVLIGFSIASDAFNQYAAVDQLPTAILGRRISRDAARRPLIGLQIFLYTHSNLVRLLLNRGSASRTVMRKECDDFSDDFLVFKKEQMRNHLRDGKVQRDGAQNAVNQIRRIRGLAGQSVPTVVALLADENQINPALQRRILSATEIAQYDFDMPQSMLIDMFGASGIQTIDVLPAMRADRRCLYMNDTHWAPAGHELAAAAILDGLVPLIARTLHVGLR